MQALLSELRKHREGVKNLLLQRAAAREQSCKGPTTIEAHFGPPHAKLFPFIGRKVWTPSGPGTLIQVFRDGVTVVLDSQLSTCSFFRPTEVEPVSCEA